MAQIGGDCVKAQRQSQVVEQMDRLGVSINKLESLSVELVGRIEPLLKAEEPQVEDKKAEVNQQLVPHADNLRHINQRVQTVTTTLAYVLERLEL